MIHPKFLHLQFLKNGIEFYTGVPDSLLKDFCAYISDNVDPGSHIISTNEGSALSLSVGYFLATQKIPVVYLQNSGFGNIINPLLSLSDRNVYGIPSVIIMGWRGEPGVKDEPQHIKQGNVLIDMIKSMNYKYEILESNEVLVENQVGRIVDYLKENSEPIFLLVKKNIFEAYESESENNSFSMTREESLSVVLDNFDSDDSRFFSTTGMLSREMFEYRVKNNQILGKDFLTVGSMGHANQIALGFALSAPNMRTICLDGDGAVLMHMGSLALIGSTSPKNYYHILFNNGAHDSVGGQPTIGHKIDFKKLAESCNYKNIYSASNLIELNECIQDLKNSNGPSFLQINIRKGSRKNLGRPTLAPLENRKLFQSLLRNL